MAVMVLAFHCHG